MSTFTEFAVGQAALTWLEGIGWQITDGAEVAPGELLAERASYSDVVLERRLRHALTRLNPELPPDAIEDAYRRLTRIEAGTDLIQQNRALYRMLVHGVNVEYRDDDGRVRGAQARVVDFGARVVQAVAHDRGAGPRRSAPAGDPSRHLGHLRSGVGVESPGGTPSEPGRNPH